MTRSVSRPYKPLEKARSEEISALAEGVADEYAPRGKVEPEAIASAKGITLSFGDYGDAFDGMLEHVRRRFHIYCNLVRVERRNSGRARFTIAHELGHYFVDDHRRALLAGEPPHGSHCDYSSSNPVEQEADLFASNLLMPATRFRKAAGRYGPGLGAILSLASEFGTSIKSTAARFVDLEIAASTIILWDDGEYSWKRLSRQVRDTGHRKTLEDVGRIPADSATGRALRGETPPATGYFETASTASLWFPYVPQGSRRDVLLREQAIKLGRFGILTMLTLFEGQFVPRFHE